MNARAAPIQPLLSAQGLSCRRGARTLFAGLSFDLGAGQLIALTGPNGSGKSTLLRVLAGLSRADEGRVDMASVEGAEAQERLHYYGHREALRDALTARENLEFSVALLCGDPGKVDLALSRMEARRLAHLPVRVLSAGQRRRVALARLIAAPRPLWLLDEPLTALDAAGQALVSELVAEHIAGGGGAIVATHQPLAVKGREIRLGEAT